MNRLAFLTLLMIPTAVGAQSAPPVPTASSPGDGMLNVEDPSLAVADTDAVSPVTVPIDNFVASRAATDASGWFGDVGFYVLRPQWSGGNPAFATTTVTPGPAGSDTTLEQTDFDHDGSFAPLVQFGYSGRNGLGLRARWWTLRSSESAAGALTASDVGVSLQGPSLLGTGSVFDFESALGTSIDGTFRNRLDLDVIDLESIWETRIGRSSLLMSAGVRYAHIGQSYDAFASLSGAQDITEEVTLRSNHTFSGAGPTFSLQGHRLIGQTNLSVYGLSRASVLFGESRRRAASNHYLEIEVPDFDPEIISDESSASLASDSLRPVLELEVGANWTRNLGAFDFFAESGLVGMVWFNAGNATYADTLVGNGARADNSDQNLGLIGLRFSSGIRF